VPEAHTGEERTEPATPRKRQEVREQGRVVQSREVSTVLVLLGGVGALALLGSSMGRRMGLLCRDLLEHPPTSPFSVAGSVTFVTGLMGQTAVVLGPFLVCMAVVAVSAHALQFGFLWSPKAFLPKGERINPIEGWRRIVSLRGAMEVVKSVFKLGVLGLLCYQLIREETPRLSGAMGLTAGPTMELLAALSGKLAIRCLIALAVLAAIDYAFQRWQFEEGIKMTRTELKYEMKESEGDPLIRARIRAIQRERARQRMMQRVPEADVVITNPTEYAVALGYDAERMPAPQVLAKGRRLIAQRIREIAEEHGIPVVEDAPLARALHAGTEVDDYIPESLYRAVAEVLSYVYQLEGRAAGQRGGPARTIPRM